MRTSGKVQHSVADHRIYIKPSLSKPIVRTRGVNRTSAAVIERNKKFAEVAPDMVVSCRGQPWPKFVACLRTKAKEKGLGTGASKTLEYRKRFWKRK